MTIRAKKLVTYAALLFALAFTFFAGAFFQYLQSEEVDELDCIADEWCPPLDRLHGKLTRV